MTEWSDRSPIPAAMLNPSLLAVLLSGAAAGYSRESATGLPWPLCFVVAPMVLHKGTREALPLRISTHLPTWVSRHPVLRAGFPLRAESLVEPVRESLRFGLRHRLLTVEDGKIHASVRLNPGEDAGDLVALLSRATFVGRWLTKLEEPATAFALLGVSA